MEYRIAIPAALYVSIEADTEEEALGSALTLARVLAVGGTLAPDEDDVTLALVGDDVRAYADDDAVPYVVDVVGEGEDVSPLHPVLDDSYDSDYEDQP